ncbi:MAG: hypothetical protein K5776_08895 [Lachnospiraceae bacterium]|nr:hypothetical protein [Lachnospiraceae bacterium]
MDKKTALIIMYVLTILGFGPVGFLIALLAGKKEVVGGRNLTQGAIVVIISWAGSLLFGLGYLVALVFSIMALIKIFQGDLEPELPVIGQINWFDK